MQPHWRRGTWTCRAMGPGLLHPCDPLCHGATATQHCLQTCCRAERASSRLPQCLFPMVSVLHPRSSSAGQCWRPGMGAACRDGQPVPPLFSPLGSIGRGALLDVKVSESGSNFQAANIPFQPQSCHKNPHCSCGQPAHMALASTGTVWQRGSRLDLLLPC